MSAVVESVAPRYRRHETARVKLRRSDLWVALSALTAALLALPLAPSSWHGPEAASVLAVSATALLAGQRWAVALVVMAELLLIPTVLPRAFLIDTALPTELMALGSLIAIVPGLLSLRRAAAALVLVTGRPRTQQTCRRFHAALLLGGLVACALPLL
jgi:hypothetical protein